MEITEKQLDQIGQLADKADNFVAASTLPMSDRIHKEQLTEGLRDISADLKKLVVAIGGHNPWED